jgi:endonuclease/exonuclease/phosphatase family metal-dependent hydrolase
VVDHQSRPTLTLATFNVHMGVDGWGRPFDVAAECAALDADILVMQESWAPDGGGPSTASSVAQQLGYRTVLEEGLAHARLFAPIPTASRRWSPRIGQVRKTLRLDRERWRTTVGPAGRASVAGQWCLALLARVPVHDVRVIQLGQLRRDPARRAVVSCTTDLGGRQVSVWGTHMSHLSHWSPAQYRLLGKKLPSPDTAAVLAGDMNLWGPPVNSFFPAWRRAVTGRTWPAHRPHSQLDHVLITEALSVDSARIAARSGSDHRPVVVRLALS